MKRLSKLLLDGAIANGFATEVWALARVAKLIEREFAVTFSVADVWHVLRALGFSSQRPTGRAIQRDEQAIKAWRTKRWPALKKKSSREGRNIIFIDESGLSERPTRVKTWAPKGQTPVGLSSMVGWGSAG